MVASAEVDLQVGAVVVVDGHAHLQHLAMMTLKMTIILMMLNAHLWHLRLVLFQVGLDKDRLVTGDDDHPLGPVLGVFVPGGVWLT